MSSPGPAPLSFPAIVEKVEEEEKAAEETARCPPSPLAHYYTSLTLSNRYAWPPFLGDWAFEEVPPRRVSTGCLAEEEDSEVQRQVEESYAKDDLTLRHHSAPNPPFLDDLRNVTVRKRNSICDIEFHFPFLPADAASKAAGERHGAGDPLLTTTRADRPRYLSISPTAASTPMTSLMTSQSSVPEWDVVNRRNSYVHVHGHEWVFFICLFVFVSLCLNISIHQFVLVLVGLQAMYCLLISLT